MRSLTLNDYYDSDYMFNKDVAISLVHSSNQLTNFIIPLRMKTFMFVNILYKFKLQVVFHEDDIVVVVSKFIIRDSEQIVQVYYL